MLYKVLAFAAVAEAFEIKPMIQKVAVPAAVAAALVATPAFAGSAGAGAGVFEGNCAACHAGGQNVIMPEKTLEKAVSSACFFLLFFGLDVHTPRAASPHRLPGGKPRITQEQPCHQYVDSPRTAPLSRAQALEEYLDGGFNEKAVIKQVTNGKGAMPAFGGRLSDDDIANVAAYVISTSSAGWE